MKVSALIEKLGKYNPNAEIDIVVNGHSKEFEICYGGSEGCTPQSCDSVDFLVDTPCESDG